MSNPPSNALTKMITSIPKVYNPDTNRVLYALLYAIALSDDQVEAAIALAKDQLFVRTATGNNLDILGKSLGVERPPTLGLPDADYQELIPNLSLKPKQIRKAFYDTADVFWGPLFSRANITSGNVAPFNVVTGDTFSIAVNNGPAQTVKVLTGDIAVNGAATAQEIINILSRIQNITPTILTDSISGNQSINIRTDAPGPVGKLNVLSSTMISTGKLNFTEGEFDILDLDQRVTVYNIRPNELFIEIPAIVPALRRTLKGAHHFHLDSTLAGPVPPDNGIWQGSFFYNPSGDVETLTVTQQRCNIQQEVSKGSVFTSVAVDDNSNFLLPSGQVIFGFGTDLQEGPIKYRGIPNKNTVLLDPAYTFKNDHDPGTTINVISQNKPYVPRTNGQDLAIYLTSPSGAREIVQGILASLAAEGITVTFQVLAPRYKYLVDNPYLSTDDAPSEN
jgi:hypothetical protein